MHVRHIGYIAVAFVVSSNATAGIIFSSTSKDEWSSYVNNKYTTIGFADVFQQIVTEQYADLGVHFTDADDYGVSNSKFVDGFGIKGHFMFGGSITVGFDSPQMWTAVNFLGHVKLEIFYEDVLVGTKSDLQTGIFNKFQGIVSDTQFNKLVISDWAGGLPFVDDLHFGGPIPAPGAIGIFGLAAIAGSRRRGPI